MRTSVRATLTIVVVLGLWATAHAGPFARPRSTEARRALRTGNTHLKVRDFDKAITAYKRGYKLEQRSIFLNNLGLAHRLKGDYKAAISYYLTVLRDTKLHKVVRTSIGKLIKQMQDELAQAARTKPPVEPEPRVAKPKPVVKPLVVRKPVPVAPWHADRLGWAFSGAGVLLAGVGVGFLASASGLRSDAATEIDVMKRNALRDSADTRETWGIVLSITGAAGLVAGIIKLIVHPRMRTGGQQGVDVALGPKSIRLVGSF